MIVRVLSVHVAPNRGAEFHAFIRDQGLPRIQAHPGLISVHVGRRTEGPDELAVVVTVWRDWQALTEALGPDPSQPYMLTPATGLVTKATVEHFEEIDLPPLPKGKGSERAGESQLATPAASS
jgi:Antibiotic biosynthesis monooxygenase